MKESVLMYFIFVIIYKMKESVLMYFIFVIIY